MSTAGYCHALARAALDSSLNAAADAPVALSLASFRLQLCLVASSANFASFVVRLVVHSGFYCIDHINRYGDHYLLDDIRHSLWSASAFDASMNSITRT
jgi:hypothetical protein